MDLSGIRGTSFSGRFQAILPCGCAFEATTRLFTIKGVSCCAHPIRYWLKCGIEYVEGVQLASAVVTNDFSDWSVTPLENNPEEAWFRVKRRDCSVEVFYSLDGSDYTMTRTAYLQSSRDIEVGVMCAAPQGPGFHISYYDLSIEDA